MSDAHDPGGEVFTLVNDRGITARIMRRGATLTSLLVPDRDGAFADVVLGFDDLAGYHSGKGYLGAIVGRHANRIALGRFTLDGVEHRLAANEPPNHLHGGLVGFDKVTWDVRLHQTPRGPAVELRYASCDGEEGYPGNLSVQVTYTLTHDDALAIEYRATTDRDTIVNLTNHAYWNLAGHDAGSILDHQLVLDAERFAPVGAGLMPTGELRPVAGTPFDFRTAHAIGERIDGDDEQLRLGGGYDHSFVIGDAPVSTPASARISAPIGEIDQLRPAARVVEPSCGRVLEVSTTEPAIQLYTGNFLDGMRGKAGAIYHRRTGLCLEAQHLPDSPNQPSFPTTTLRAGAHYRSTTVYRFAVSPG